MGAREGDTSARSLFRPLLRSACYAGLHITLAIWVRVKVTGDAHVTKVLGMGTAGLSLRFQVAGYLLLVAGEVASF